MIEKEKEAIRLLNLCINSNLPLPEEALSWVKILLSYITKLEEENKHLKEQLLISNDLDNMYNLNISKDKIRDKIKELQEELEKEMKEVEDFTDFNPMIPVLMTERDTLSNLLGEEDEEL